MSKTWTVIKREYLSRVKTKGFIIGTLAMPVMILVLGLLPSVFMRMKSENQYKSCFRMEESNEIS